MKNKLKIFLPSLIVFFIILSSSNLSFAQEDMGSLEIILKYTSGDRLGLYQTIVTVYQDNNEEPYVVVGFPETNPFLIDPLPIGHRYQVDVHVNGMLAETTKIDVDGDEKLEMFLPNAGGYVFVVYYDDGTTPVEGAKLTVRSNDGFQWSQDKTDDDGKTMRFWLQSNNAIEDYYVAEVTLDETIVYTFPDDVKIFPNLQRNIEIVTPWPKKIQDLVTVSVYLEDKKVSKSDGKFIVEMYNNAKIKIDESQVSVHGNAFFSNMGVGHYVFQALRLPDDPEGIYQIWGQTSADIAGVENSFSISKKTSEGPGKSCNCVSFRLDDVQDHFLNNPQIGVMKLFQGKNAPLSIGIIGGFIGNDPKIVDLIKKDQARTNPTLEIVSHSWNNSPLTNYDQKGQTELLKKTDDRIVEVFGVSPTLMIPPENLLNDDTLASLQELHYTHVSGHVETEIYQPSPLYNQTVYYYPANSETAMLNSDTNLWDTQSNESILARINDHIINYGHAVVMMHPYEFSVADLGIYTNEANQEQLEQTSALIDRIRNMGIDIVRMGQIEEYVTESIEKVEIGEEVKSEENCNCVAFRLVNLQDYWLDDVQIEIMKTFVEKDARITIGIIGNLFGYDAKLVNYIKNEIETDEQSIEIANNGWDYEDFTGFIKEEQSGLIKQTNEHLWNVLGKSPTVFIPPLEKFNDATILALSENNIKYISSSVKKDPSPYILSDAEFYHFPGGPSMGKFDPIVGAMVGASHNEVLPNVEAHLDKYGFAVVTIQPQEFSIVENNVYTNQVNLQQIEELKLLIDKIQAQGLKIVPVGQINQYATDEPSGDTQFEYQTCDCVAFRFITLQDYWLNDVQVEVIDTFIRKDATVVTGIVGNLFGDDLKMINKIKNALEVNEQSIEIANNGWDYVDFTEFTKEEQSGLIKQTNEHLWNVLGKSPTVFIPPLEKFNDATISALSENNIKHISSSFKEDPPPYRLSDAEFYHFPWTAAVGSYDPRFDAIKGISHEQTLAEVLLNLDKYGFAVVTIQPQDYSVVVNGTYTNQVNQHQIEELELLIDKIQAQGLKIIPISKINLDSTNIPPWIKNNAGWWSDGEIDDSTFIQGIQFLINEKIMKLPPSEQSSGSEELTEIPGWVKNNAGWWSDGEIDDSTFIQGIQWLITNGIMKIN